MATAANTAAQAAQARRIYSETLLKGVPAAVRSIGEAARVLLDQPAEGATQFKRRELVESLKAGAGPWQVALVNALRSAILSGGMSASHPGDLPRPSSRSENLTLVDDDTIDREILSSRLALAMMDRASLGFNDLRTRIAHLERHEELDADDMLRAHVLARIALNTWRASGMTLSGWRLIQGAIHEEFAVLAEVAYHEVNRWLIGQRVMPEIDLRPLIRRHKDVGVVSGGGVFDPYISSSGASTGIGRGGVGEETRMLTRAAPLAARTGQHAEAVLGRLNRLIGRQLPEFAHTAQQRTMSPGLRAALGEAQQSLQRRLATGRGPGVTAAGAISTPALLEDLQQRRRALKQAAATPVERATIEIVALLFQSILTEERIPATVRVWFARLQMPVLRVAVGEPDFFATTDHPARRLIDRMGACVMGFDASARAVGDALEKEIKRVVQVVEAYPDTGRRVFQTVLTEFEKFLEHYFKNENEASRKGVSLAQQVEQRETMAIQYTIELRKMLNEVPVQEGVRDFLFHVWADVLAMTAVKHGVQGDETKAMKRAAADLIWSASA